MHPRGRQVAQHHVVPHELVKPLPVRVDTGLSLLHRAIGEVKGVADAVVDEYLKQSRAILDAGLVQLANAPKPFGDQAKKLREELGELGRRTSVHRRRMQFLGGLRKDHAVYVPRLGRRCTVKKVDRVREVLTVEIGKMRIEIPFEDASWLQPLE